MDTHGDAMEETWKNPWGTLGTTDEKQVLFLFFFLPGLSSGPDVIRWSLDGNPPQAAVEHLRIQVNELVKTNSAIFKKNLQEIWFPYIQGFNNNQGSGNRLGSAGLFKALAHLDPRESRKRGRAGCY